MAAQPQDKCTLSPFPAHPGTRGTTDHQPYGRTARERGPGGKGRASSRSHQAAEKDGAEWQAGTQGDEAEVWLTSEIFLKPWHKVVYIPSYADPHNRTRYS